MSEIPTEIGRPEAPDPADRRDEPQRPDPADRLEPPQRPDPTDLGDQPQHRYPRVRINRVRADRGLLADIDVDEPDLREPGRRSTPMSFALRADLKDRLTRLRNDGRTINVSEISNKAIEGYLDRIESSSAIVQRLRMELTERHGPSWTMGYQAGRKWAEDTATWLEITEFATRYTGRDVKVEMYHEDTEYMYVAFTGRFQAPVRDYGRDAHHHAAAPAFQYVAEDGDPKWEFRTLEIEPHWRAWLTAVRECYDELKDDLPPVIDQLPAEEIPDPYMPRDVSPDDIPF